MFMKQKKKIGLLCLRVHSAPSGGRCLRLCVKLCPMSDCGSGHFIEFDDPLRLKWRSSSLRAEGILHRQQGNRKKITVPADFIVSLISINQGSKEV